INLTIFILFLTVISCSGQSTKIDTFSGEIKVNNQISFEATKQSVKSEFGQPNDITTEYWEIGQETATAFHYSNGATLKFGDQGLESFKLTSSNYYIKMGSFELRVGKSISSIQNVFPKSYNYRNSDTTSIALGIGDYRFLLIEYNSTGKITSIDVRTF